MIKKYGTVTKIKILQIGARPLIRFSLNDTNCLIAGHGLNFLAEVDEGMRLVISVAIIIKETNWSSKNIMC